ncbi:uncharacterized protein [Ptychodera flava]|uniref:uncharacterized protein n=1 Tax=Ptychodera flava TaxID=63121 RepID=UPI003969E213
MLNVQKENIFISTRENQKNKLQRLLTKAKKRQPLETDYIPERWVKNLSTQELTPAERQLLAKGPKFAITPSQIPIKQYIVEIENSISKHLQQPEADKVRGDIVRILEKAKPPSSNITSEQRNALNNLVEDKTRMCLTADKGNAMVVMDAEDYKGKINKMLSVTSTYEKLKNDPTTKSQRQLCNILKSIKDKGELPDHLYNKLRPAGRSTPAPKFYGLPKIHKADVPLRPIVSSIGSCTYNTAKELARIIGPLVGKSPHHIKDTTEFVNKMKNKVIPPDYTIVSFDVSALFTSIPTDKALKCIQQRLQDDDTLQNRTTMSTASICKLLEFCLDNTFFVYNSNFYRQCHGAAMGSPISPIVANLYMEMFENEALAI